jgi:hypothetical protein
MNTSFAEKVALIHDLFDALGWTGKCIRFCVALCLMVTPPIAMGQIPQPAPSSVSTQTSVGIFLIAVHDVDTIRDNFLAEFYVWTRSPADAPDPLASAIVIRATTQTVLNEWHKNFRDQIWTLRKYRCEVHNDWDLGNFPFDKHILGIAVVPNGDQYNSSNYQLDQTNSGMAKPVALHGWKISDFKILSQNVGYESNFGDPESAASYHYDAVTASFLLIRDGWQLFFKLMAGAYLATCAALLGCFMRADQPPIFAGRMGLQIGCLFAAIINNRDIGNAAGQRDTIILPDTLHILIYLLIFASLLLTLRSRSLNHRGQETRALREERGTTLLLTFIFLFLNCALIWGALAAAPSHNMLQVIQFGD